MLLSLAADALDEAGATRGHPVPYEDIRERYLPEIELRGRADHHKACDRGDELEVSVVVKNDEAARLGGSSNTRARPRPGQVAGRTAR